MGEKIPLPEVPVSLIAEAYVEQLVDEYQLQITYRHISIDDLECVISTTAMNPEDIRIFGEALTTRLSQDNPQYTWEKAISISPLPDALRVVIQFAKVAKT